MSKATESLLGGAYVAVPNHAKQIHPSPSPLRFRKALKVVAYIIVAICLASIVVWHVFRPKPIKVYVAHATLTQFAITETRNLNYNLSLSLVFKNPNKRGHIKYKWLHASSYYHGEMFGRMPIHGFRQGCRSITTVNTVLAGVKTMSSRGLQLDGMHRQLDGMHRDSMEGFFDVDVRVYAWMKYKIGCFKTKHHIAKIKCKLEGMVLEGKENSSEAGGFKGTRCDVHF